MGKDKVTEEYGSLLFTDAVMQERLPKPTYKELKQVIEEGKKGGKEVLIIKEIPPKLTTGKIVEEITALCREREEGKRKVPGLLQDKISDIKDLSAKTKVEIIVYPKRGVSLPVLKNLILENTSMTYSHKYMMNILSNGNQKFSEVVLCAR